jgi:hypothetical protein
VCKFGRATFHKAFRGYGATYGNCPSKKETYLGYKLHMLATLDGFVTDFVITPANIDDREGVWDLISSYQSITLIGDKGYIGANFEADLKSEKGIGLLPINRKSSKNQYPTSIMRLIFKLRGRIETSASQLTQQLNIEKVMAKLY